MDNSFAGYPVIIEHTDWYKENQHVSGMAAGGFDTGEDPYISINGYAKQMKNPNARRNLMRIEASRHLMHETNYDPKWEMTDAQKTFQKSFEDTPNGEYYAKNIDNSFRETLISRSIGMSPKHGNDRNFIYDNQVVKDPKTGEYFADESIEPIPLTKEQIEDRDKFDTMIVARNLIDKLKRESQ
tara:strand:- start:51 stop:602 length:552 start_codon:yes stop_codon:yes gene_type:complete